MNGTVLTQRGEGQVYWAINVSYVSRPGRIGHLTYTPTHLDHIKLPRSPGAAAFILLVSVIISL